MQKLKGNTIAEYAITSSILLPLLISVVPNLNQSISQLLQDSLKTSPIQANSLQGPEFGSILQAKNPVSQNITNNPTGSVTGQIFLSPTQSLTLSSIPATFSQAVETSGVNGATSLYSDAIASIASQLLITKQISDKSYQILMELSNQGHKIAGIQGLLEEAAKTSSGLASFESKVFTYNGSTYSTKDLAGLTDSPVLDTENPIVQSLTELKVSTPPYGWGAEMLQFANLYQQAVRDGSLANPDVKIVVDFLVSNISASSDSLATGIGLSTLDLTNIAQQIIADTNNISSQNICTVGNGTDSGLKCN